MDNGEAIAFSFTVLYHFRYIFKLSVLLVSMIGLQQHCIRSILRPTDVSVRPLKLPFFSAIRLIYYVCIAAKILHADTVIIILTVYTFY